MQHSYRGRFAPSPTGPLHIGSLLSAVGSYLQAKSQNGKWLVRIEDLDPPREVKGASSDILKTLEAFGLYWDEEVIYQSKQHHHYRDALEQLTSKRLLYPCSCSRKQIQEASNLGKIGYIYPGLCRNGLLTTKERNAQRLISEDIQITFEDKIQGLVCQNIYQDVGDIVLLRADGFYAYHLAVVVDDYRQNITEVVRGYDLINCTPIQRYLQQCLAYSTPTYAHLPIIIDKNGEKLSKQTGAEAVSFTHIESTLFKLLALLGQNPPLELNDGTVCEILNWAVKNWSIKKCTKTKIKSTH